MSKRITTYRGATRGVAAKRRAMVAMVATGLLALATAAGAQGASPPTVTTGGASVVSYGSATLGGWLNPHGSDTSYYFQYGPTTAFGAQTGILDAGAGTHAVHVAIAISGLQPLTVYHFRLVAVNANGPKAGANKAFQTVKVPLSLAILGSPDPVFFQAPLTVQGTLSGTENANRPVVLQANSFPYTAGFTNVGNPELTTTTGSFSFPLLGLTQSTQFRVVTTTKSPVISPVFPENVAVRVSAHAGHVGPRGRARIYGTVTPAVDGMRVGIMRVVHGHNVLSGAAVLVHNNAQSSRFSVVQHAKLGVYRVFVAVTNGSLVSSFSAPFFVR